MAECNTRKCTYCKKVKNKSEFTENYSFTKNIIIKINEKN